MAEISSISPLDGKLIGSYPVSSRQEIDLKLNAARQSAHGWAQTPIAERVNTLKPLSQLILKDLDRLTEVIVNTTGKVKTEALLGEIYPVLSQAGFYDKNAVKILSPRPVSSSPFAFPDATAVIEQRPVGVVAVISPWNYPFQLSLISMLTALYAGNGVILKASEFSLPVAEAIMALLGQLSLPEGLVQWVTGAGESGEHLIDARPDLVLFTGSLATGRKVMQRAAQHPIPVILELGGNNALLVFADAHLDRAANAAVYGAFVNSGQVCVATKRVLVESTCFDELLTRLINKTAALKIGHGEDGDLGAIINANQIKIVQEHYQDAIAKGAKASAALTVNGNYLNPVVLWDVTQDMRIMQEETFGPLLAVMPFEDEQQAIKLANSGHTGLNASVWSRDIAKARRITRQLQCGNWAINDVIKNIGHPALPFGGMGNSGFGRYHGAEGLLSFSQPVSGLTSYNALAHEPNWFPYSETRFGQFKGYLDFLYGLGAFWQRARRNQETLQPFRAYSGLHLRQHAYNLKAFFNSNRFL
jgi:4,4'-diapolycopenoate synthase